ncbi:hypothetical protein Syun_024155 [Stephania yunnanensis]|uniref:Uncharacterized protein n=1 Tax=Stephania yunnanensis TaxID=152371 RepID=A0AAP0FRF2_9MAGN
MQRRNSAQKRSGNRWRRSLFVLVLLSFCFGSLLLTQTQFAQIKRFMPLPPPFVQKPKIAFLFIARNRLPLDVVWDAFFKVDWGEASMIQAEHLLLKNALNDTNNERFVFLSDSQTCLLFVETTAYTIASLNLMPSALEQISDICSDILFADTKEGRYNPKMYPVVPVDHWRKGSQWVVLTRKHAEVVVNDDVVLPVFQQHCRPVDASKEHNCIPDEHYVQTLLAVSAALYVSSFCFKSLMLSSFFSLLTNFDIIQREGLEEEITRRSLTHSSWDLSASKDRERRGWHPVTYKMADATPMLIQSIKDIDNIYYETEYRREWCTSKDQPSKCFLFARKFTRPAAHRLLNLVLYPNPALKLEN